MSNDVLQFLQFHILRAFCIFLHFIDIGIYTSYHVGCIYIISEFVYTWRDISKIGFNMGKLLYLKKAINIYIQSIIVNEFITTSVQRRPFNTFNI